MAMLALVLTAMPGLGAQSALPYHGSALPYHGVYPTEYPRGGKFPADFVWGTGTASYQIEGAWNEDGRGRSIWDTFSGAGGAPPNQGHEVIGDNGDTACDFYHRYREDIKLMVELGLKSFRFSIAWPRLLPNGTLAGGINQKGVDFYNRVIEELLVHGIEPYVTLYHWDLPEALQTQKLPGWLDKRLVPLFEDYAKLCYDLFGDRVKFWTTFNEARTFVVYGYGKGSKAPGRPYIDIGTHPYTAGHNVLLAHARAVRAFRAHPKTKANGAKIGITNNCDWNEPASSAPSDIAAAERANEWMLAWFADPIWLGDYPASMRKKLGSRLPKFTRKEQTMLKGSADFFGLNHYQSQLTRDSPMPPDYGLPNGTGFTYWADYEAAGFHTADMPKAASVWLFAVPWGLRQLLNWIDRRYGSPAIYIMENGWSTPGGESWKEGVSDDSRVLFYANYTSEVQRAIYEDGIAVRGYFAWSLIDNFEWERGYSERFGIVYTDFQTKQRYIKASAKWYAAAIAANAAVDPAPFLTPPSTGSRAGAKLNAGLTRLVLLRAVIATSILAAIWVVRWAVRTKSVRGPPPPREMTRSARGAS